MKLSKANDVDKDFCVISSNRMYAVLNQSGAFTPHGFHVDGKMSGIFAQPFRLSDGFTIKSNNTPLKASSYTFNNGQGIFEYDNFTTYINAFDNESILCINSKGSSDATFEMEIKIDGCWSSELCDFKIGETIFVEQSSNYAIFKHEFEPCFVMVYLVNSDCLEVDGTKVSAFLSDDIKIAIISADSLQDVKKWINNLDIDNFISEQQKRREKLLSQTSIKTNIPKFDTAFNSLKLNYDMLVQKIPNLGEGYTPGCPDFMWFLACDVTYSTHGTLSVGQMEMTKKTLRLLKDVSVKANNNGRVIHEVSPFGFVYNKGNLQETPHFLIAVYMVYMWTGDKEFLDEMLPFCIDGMKWAESKIEDGSLCPKGAGIVEVTGLEGRVIDIAVLMIDAYGKLAELCEIYGKTDDATEFLSKKKALEVEVLEKFYCKDEEFFADIICTFDEVKNSRDILVNSIKNTVTMTKELGLYFDKLLSKDYQKDELIPVVIKNWVTILPYGEDFVPTDIKQKGLETMKTQAFYNDCGMKLACRCDDKNDPIHDIYTLNKSMSINTGCLAEVFAKNNDIDHAFNLLMTLVNTMDKGMVGAISEILPNDGCFMMLWSGYGIHHVFLRHILGIKPNAPAKTLEIKPNLPKEMDYIYISNLTIGDCVFDIEFKRENGVIKVQTTQSDENYKVVIAD